MAWRPCGFPPALQNQALASGYAVVDQTSVLATHLAEVVKQHAHELLSRQEVKRLLDRLAESHPKLVEELVPKVLSLGEVQKVLQQLLREQVSIRDLPAILETLLDTAPTTKNPVVLVESVRQSLGRALVRPLLSETGGLRVVTLDHALEEELGRAFGAQAPAARGHNRTAAALCPPHSRRPAPAGGRTGGGGQSGAAVLDPGALSPEAAARTLSAQAGRAFSAGGAAGGRGAVGGSFAMTMAGMPSHDRCVAHRNSDAARTDESYEEMRMTMSKNTAQAYTAWQDNEERDRILLEQLPQVRYLARRIHERLPRHVPLEDLVHAGVIGLIDALNKFDSSKHVQFGSYAKFRIRGAILDSLREMDWGPRELRRKARKVEEAHRKLSLELSRAPPRTRWRRNWA